MRALAGFDPNGHAALQIQDFYRAYICVSARPLPCARLHAVDAITSRRQVHQEAQESRRGGEEARPRREVGRCVEIYQCVGRRGRAGSIDAGEILISTQGGREEPPRRGSKGES